MQDGRRRLRVRTESVTSVMDSDFGLTAAGIGWGSAWDGVPAGVRSSTPVGNGRGRGSAEGGWSESRGQVVRRLDGW